MPRLIVLNGMPAVGKTTQARRYAAAHRLTLVLDLDSIRRLLGGWRDDPTQAGLVARELSVPMARAHLRAGRDVVVPQYLGRPEFLGQLEAVGRETEADYAEFVLTDDRDTLFRRFAARTAAAAEPAHVEAGDQIARLGGEPVLVAMYDRLLQLVNTRRNVQVLHCPEGAEDDVYAELQSRLDE